MPATYPSDPATLAEFAKTAGKPIQCKAAVAWAANKPLSNETIIVAPPQAGPGAARAQVLVPAGHPLSHLYTSGV